MKRFEQAIRVVGLGRGAASLNVGCTLLVAICIAAPACAQWIPNGVPVCTAESNQGLEAIVPDQAGGAIFVWGDSRGSVDVYAQHVDSTGTVQWAAGGVVVCDAAGLQTSPAAITDGFGGAIVMWRDNRISGSNKLYGQRINSLGLRQWASDGVPLSVSPGTE